MTLKIHPTVTIDRVTDAVERSHTSLDNPGFCIECGADADDCEPDAKCYVCAICDEPAVYGAEELMFHLVL